VGVFPLFQTIKNNWGHSSLAMKSQPFVFVKLKTWTGKNGRYSWKS